MEKAVREDLNQLYDERFATNERLRNKPFAEEMKFSTTNPKVSSWYIENLLIFKKRGEILGTLVKK
ncbi:hypothetical protein ACFL2O_10850 [Thermodesulfobacteriota bacterium]